jgi:hypothetical protein
MPGIKRSQLSCRRCWFRLPASLRRRLNDDPGRMDLVLAATEWYEKHPL